MKAQLVKRQDRWDLYIEDGSKIASSAPNPMNKLSIKNCEAVENGYDLDELANKFTEHFNTLDVVKSDIQVGYKAGFQKALEIIGDKKLSLQQTEFDVEIETEPYVKYVSRTGNTVYPPLGIQNKLNSDGCLILKGI